LVVDFEVIEGDFVGLFADFFNQIIDFVLFKRHVDVHGKQAHEGDHEFLLKGIRQYLGPDD
jgi:hypothetical protein